MKPDEIPQEIYTFITNAVNSAVTRAFEQFSSRPQEDTDYLSAVQAANFLKITLNTLYSKVEKGELPHYRSGKRKLLFLRKELTDFISSHKSKSNKDIENEVDRYRFGK